MSGTESTLFRAMEEAKDLITLGKYANVKESHLVADSAEADASQVHPPPLLGQGGREPLPVRKKDWKVRRKDVRRAIQCSGDSAPGPDGIPYCAWRSLGDIGIDILWSVAHALESGDSAGLLREAYHDEVGGRASV